MVSNETYDRDTSRVCKKIIEKGSFNNVVTKISIPKSAHLLDIKEIGSTKYSELKRILNGENVKLPPYKVVSLFRREISLADEMRIVQNPEGFSVGIAISYHSILSLTIQRTLENLDPISDTQYPLNVTISDGLDGSGTHRIYNQINSNPDLSTKSFILFGFKVLTITDTSHNQLFFNKFPNSPFSFRPLALIALKEDYGNVKFIMETLINPETDHIMEDGFNLGGGQINVKNNSFPF